MSYFPEAEPGSSFPPFVALREHFGFVPRLFLAQSLLPRVIEAEVGLVSAVLFTERKLTRIQKETILFALSAGAQNKYCAALHYQTLRLLGVAENRLDAADIRYASESPAEIVMLGALSRLLTTLATGLGVEPDFEPPPLPEAKRPVEGGLPATRLTPRDLIDFTPFIFTLLDTILSPEELLTRRQKAGILLQIGDPGQRASDAGLLDFAVKLAVLPEEFAEADVEGLRGLGFTDPQILEAITAVSLASFLQTLQKPLATISELVPAQNPHLLDRKQRPSEEGGFVDPDAAIVSDVRAGNIDAFEELIHRHGRRVYRCLAGILGSQDEARDAMQDTFLKAYQHLGDFEGRSKFSTWVLSIASNTGLQRLRERRRDQSLEEDDFETDEGFRPRQIRAWTDDPEKLYSRAERRALVESMVMRLPAKYRVVLVMRDLEQLSIQETCEALGLGIPAVKARLLRARLMLRESLSPHFASGSKPSQAREAAHD